MIHVLDSVCALQLLSFNVAGGSQTPWQEKFKTIVKCQILKRWLQFTGFGLGYMKGRSFPPPPPKKIPSFPQTYCYHYPSEFSNLVKNSRESTKASSGTEDWLGSRLTWTRRKPLYRNWRLTWFKIELVPYNHAERLWIRQQLCTSTEPFSFSELKEKEAKVSKWKQDFAGCRSALGNRASLQSWRDTIRLLWETAPYLL